MKTALAIVAVVLCTASLHAQPEPSAPPPANQPEASKAVAPAMDESLRRRLEALDPGNPESYFELGEEIAADAADPATVQLARRLLVLAYHLDRARGGQRLAAACCLALADLGGPSRDRRWLWSLASALDRRHARPDWVRRSQEQFSSDAGLRASSVLGLYRSGDGRAALELLKEPGVRRLLSGYERALSFGADTGALKALEREADRWPCPECHNQRIVKKSGLAKDVQYKLCGNCNGNPGPRLSTTELLAQLRLESALLRGIQRSWAAQASTDLGTPLRDPDPDELPRVMDVDPAKVLYRAGQWVAIEGPPAPAPAPPSDSPGP